ncbi:MAG: histidinol-phosphate transaminase [Gemmatimonadota bacterium]
MSNTHVPFLPHIARMVGYVPGEQPRGGKVIKLNTNENPYPPSPLVLERLRDACGDGLRLYPDAAARGVRERLSRLFDLPVEQILVGNGSDEILNVIVRSFAGPGDEVAMAVPTYPYYRKLLELQDAVPAEVPYPDDYSLPAELARRRAPLTLVANPNSPSGTAASRAAVEAVVEGTPGMVVLDEAYVDFAEGGFLDLVRANPRVIVTRTMSKSFSLAGLRIGFCFAAPDVIAGLWRVKEHYNLNTLSQVAAEAALDDIDTMRSNAARVCRTRQRLTDRLHQLGLQVWESQANFVLARLAGRPAAEVCEALKERGILVRYFAQPRLADCLRISIGTDAQIDVLLAELAGLLRSTPGR